MREPPALIQLFKIINKNGLDWPFLFMMIRITFDRNLKSEAKNDIL